MKGCAFFAAFFLLGVGIFVGGFVYDVMNGGLSFQDETPGDTRAHTKERDLARKLEVGGISLTFATIFGAAGWGFYRRVRTPDDSGPEDPRSRRDW